MTQSPKQYIVQHTQAANQVMLLKNHAGLTAVALKGGRIREITQASHRHAS
jgi:hypothetical protein